MRRRTRWRRCSQPIVLRPAPVRVIPLHRVQAIPVPVIQVTAKQVSEPFRMQHYSMGFCWWIEPRTKYMDSFNHSIIHSIIQSIIHSFIHAFIQFLQMKLSYNMILCITTLCHSVTICFVSSICLWRFFLLFFSISSLFLFCFIPYNCYPFVVFLCLPLHWSSLSFSLFLYFTLFLLCVRV